MNVNTPYIFDEFFTSGLEESISPFLDKRSRLWAKNLCLKGALLSGFFLLCSFITKFYCTELSHLFLLFVYFFSGAPALLHTIEDLGNLEINIDVLMTMAALLSFLIGSQMEGGLLLVLFSLSGAMEKSVSRKAKGTLHNLNHLAPSVGIVIDEDGRLHQKSVKEIDVGTQLLVKAGEVVPLDGTVIAGHSFVNLVHLTGESIPVSKKSGDTVQAGSRNLDGTLTIHVTKTSAESTLSKIIQLVNDAQEMKPQLQRFLDRFSKIYAITIISLFALFVCTLPFILSIPFLGNEGSLYRALTFLIAASPCALIIATPTAYLSAISACARNGILLKGGIILDALANCKIVAFDKTGTLTTGELSCTKIECLSQKPQCTIDKALSIAFSLERNITHPIAKAICALAMKKKIKPTPITHFQSIPGFGLKAQIDSVEVKIGNEEFINPQILIKKDREMLSLLRVGKTLFSFHFHDTIRPKISTTLQNLKQQHLHLIMLTGDHEKSAHRVAQEIGLDHVYANLRPEHKVETLAQLAVHAPIAMVGDGINDAPALTRANVGISMGKIGSATAVDASDIVLLKDDLSLMGFLYKKASKTIHIVRENLVLALSVIFLATVPAVLGFIPIWLAVLLHEGGTVLVGVNSLRLLKS